MTSNDYTNVTFFMPIIDRGIEIADYSIKSYAKLKNISFKLLIYSNGCSETTKNTYFDRWRRNQFVEIHANEWQTDQVKPEGLVCEKHGAVLDRELKKIQSPYIATVDYDFEILNPNYIYEMIDTLESRENLVALSVSHSPRRRVKFYHPRLAKTIEHYRNERWEPWFCIYKRKALECEISHLYYEEIKSPDELPEAWDTSARFQAALIRHHGYDISAIDQKFRHQYIHYQGMGWMRGDRIRNLFLWRLLRIISEHGINGRGYKVMQAAQYLLKKLYPDGN